MPISYRNLIYAPFSTDETKTCSSICKWPKMTEKHKNKCSTNKDWCSVIACVYRWCMNFMEGEASRGIFNPSSSYS